MIFGTIHIELWVVLFLITIVYEILYVHYILAISKLRPFLTANISLMLGAVGMACVILYTEDINNCIPILGATWLSSYFIVDLERKKRAKEKQNNDIKNND